ncbi:MAG: biotin transporter BioY [Alphaproteobacteria bacterium]|nr:biotin transporter BioY [Alphaproteobacteria bacterium]
MTAATEAHPTLASSLWPEAAGSRLVRAVILAVIGSLLLWASAKIKVPFYPVPMTMQTFAVLVIGMAYGWRLGGATLLLYLAEGAVGLPVFTQTPEKGIGLPYMMGPTGGYLIGFALAAMASGYLAERGWDRSLLKTAAAMLVGNAIIYVPGVLWLAALIGMEKAIQFGLTPFLLSDAVKLALAACLMPFAWSLISRARG